MNRAGFWYDTAEICLNGHIISSQALSKPECHEEYCNSCGEKTIQTCQNCNSPIRGYYHRPNIAGITTINTPSFCYNCGNPYPWTETRLQAAQDLINEIDELSEEEKEKFADSLPDVIADTPKTPLAATRFNKVLRHLHNSKNHVL